MKIKQFKKKKLPQTPGVYMFMSGQKILYIGRATSLKERVKSYFSKDVMATRGPIILTMVKKATGLKTISTDSVLEALLLEAHLIKTHQPAYNSREKDNKSFNYIVITREDFPRVLLVRGRQLEQEKNYLFLFGPFIHGNLLKDAIKIIRKIFPFRDTCVPATLSRAQGTSDNVSIPSTRGTIYNSTSSKNTSRDVEFVSHTKSVGQIRACFNRQLGLCPGVCSGEISKTEYQKHIRNLALFLKGERRALISSLKKEMKTLASRQEFEKAGEIKRTLFSLKHIQDVALIKNVREMTTGGPPLASLARRGPSASGETSLARCGPKDDVRIEAYDIAHTSGTSTVGVITVLQNGEIDKSQYRKFRIQGLTRGNDIKALREILLRRLKHSEWPLPGLIVADGGVAQMHALEKIIKQNGLSIKVVGVVKDERHVPRDIYGDREVIRKYEKDILLVNNEAHRFALSYHRELRSRIDKS